MIPIGFRFEPTEEEVIRAFLLPQVMGLELPWDGIIERKVYGDDAAPWLVFSDAGEPSVYWTTKKEAGVTKNTTYVFTKLTMAYGATKKPPRISRTAGGGTWGGQTSKKIKNSDTGDLIGYSKMFTFESSKFDVSLGSELGHWIMHEYSLGGAALAATGLTGACDLVICKITRCIKNSRCSGPRGPLQPQFVLPNKRAAEECSYQEVEETSRKKHKSLDGEGEGFVDAAEAAVEAAGDFGNDPDSWLISVEGFKRFLDGTGGTEDIIVGNVPYDCRSSELDECSFPSSGVSPNGFSPEEVLARLGPEFSICDIQGF